MSDKSERHPFYPEIELTDYWPQAKPVYTGDIRYEGSWIVAMDRGGVLSLWPKARRQKRGGIPEGLIAVYEHNDKTVLDKALLEFCKLGYETDPDLIHTDGRVSIFNWRSFTMWQLGVATKVLHLFATGRVDEAWTFGRACGEQVDAAIRYQHESPRS
jgi:hypothetical protein